MTEAANNVSFEQVVEWAYRSLPEKIRNLPDFPGIQIVDEPPDGMLEKMSKSRTWPQGTELLGCYSGIRRTERQHNSVQLAPDLIFVFRGPILRCSKGNLSVEVKQVVWHEVAHWLGHSEAEVKELGLSRRFKDMVPDPFEREASISLPQNALQDATETQEETNGPPRCIKCYSKDVTCHELGKLLKPHGAWLTDPAVLPSRICKCGSCGYEWNDEDNG